MGKCVRYGWELALLLTVLKLEVCVGFDFEQRVRKARSEGKQGYDLIDALDIWFGHNSPEYNGPWQQLDALGNRDRKVTVEDWLAAGLPEEHFHYFDKDKNGQMDKHEAHSWHQQRQPARTMNVKEVNNPPRGHLERLGAWKDPLPSEDLTYHKPYPHPRDFWEKHLTNWKPAVLKGAQAGWEGMKWTREVLTEKFGWVDAKLEPKVEARGNDTAYKELDKASRNHRMSVAKYLEVEKGKNMYVVSTIPQAMAWEVAHPSPLLCGSRRKMLNRRSSPPYKTTQHEYPHEANFTWMTHVFEANLWIASGFTRSQFHYDKEWNVNCLLSGTKRWFFLDNFNYSKDLQWSRGNKFKPKDPLNNAWTDWVYLDPEHVDLIVQHKLPNMDYYELLQEAGDCIFIPYAMLHQVTKVDDGLQVAASWMFLPESLYDEEACAEAPLDEDLPLAAMDTLYMYSGKGLIPQGYMDPLHFVQTLERQMKATKQEYLSIKLFTRAVTQGGAIFNELKPATRKEKIKALFDRIVGYAKDPSKGLGLKELRSVPLRIWAKAAAEGDEEGPLPCDKGQEYEPCSDEEFRKIKAYVESRIKKKPSDEL